MKTNHTTDVRSITGDHSQLSLHFPRFFARLDDEYPRRILNENSHDRRCFGDRSFPFASSAPRDCSITRSCRRGLPDVADPTFCTRGSGSARDAKVAAVRLVRAPSSGTRARKRPNDMRLTSSERELMALSLSYPHYQSLSLPLHSLVSSSDWLRTAIRSTNPVTTMRQQRVG